MHAVCITAYKDYPQLVRLVRRLDPMFFRIYVHLDKRKSAFSDDQVEELRALGCEVHKKFGIWWGSFSHLQAIMFLMKRAVEQGGVDYVHVISGQDYPLCGPEEFKRRCDGRIFIEYTLLDEEPEHVLWRYRTYNPFFFLQGAWKVTKRLYGYLNPISRWVQKRFEINRLRFGQFTTIYKGRVWCSLPVAAAARLIQDKMARDYLKAVRTAFVPEEIFIQTYFLHSDLRHLVVNDHLRYTDWTERNGSRPAFLDETDAEVLSHSTALFARKMDSKIASKLLDIIDGKHFGGAAAPR